MEMKPVEKKYYNLRTKTVFTFPYKIQPLLSTKNIELKGTVYLYLHE